jgi:hypothetical protein
MPLFQINGNTQLLTNYITLFFPQYYLSFLYKSIAWSKGVVLLRIAVVAGPCGSLTVGIIAGTAE